MEGPGTGRETKGEAEGEKGKGGILKGIGGGGAEKNRIEEAEGVHQEHGHESSDFRTRQVEEKWKRERSTSPTAPI